MTNCLPLQNIKDWKEATEELSEGKSVLTNLTLQLNMRRGVLSSGILYFRCHNVVITLWRGEGLGWQRGSRSTACSWHTEMYESISQKFQITPGTGASDNVVPIFTHSCHLFLHLWPFPWFGSPERFRAHSARINRWKWKKGRVKWRETYRRHARAVGRAAFIPRRRPAKGWVWIK